MHPSPIIAVLGFGIFCATPLHAEKPTAEALLDAAINNPGTWSQMCDIQFVPRKTPLPLYGLVLDTEFQLTPVTLAQLRARRDEMIPVLVQRLKAIDFAKAPVPAEMKLDSNTENLISTGLDPHHLSQLLLHIIIDLNAAECLPELLRLESDISARLEAHNSDPKKSPLPEFQLEAGFLVGDMESFSAEIEARGDRDPTEAEIAEREEIQKRVTAIVVQRDLLATMLAVLRQEKYGPVLSSTFEKIYAAKLKEQAAEENLEMIKSEADISPNDADYIAIDPIVGLPFYPGRKSTEIAYTPALRQDILDWTRAFVKLPQDKRLGAKGMSSRPYVR